MTPEPRSRQDYGERLVAAARRVLVDLGQVLASEFGSSIVLVGGWVPDLLLPEPAEPHIGSMDVDLALDPEKLGEGRYAEVVKSILATNRYERTDRPYRLEAAVDLEDGEPSILVHVDFLKVPGKRGRRAGAPLLEGFRPLDARGCAAAFCSPENVQVRGSMISGADNVVSVSVSSIPAFLVMKAHAIARRDKPKDAYDLCFCLDHYLPGREELARALRSDCPPQLLAGALEILREKFASVDSYGPRQVADFYDASSADERNRHARRAYELVVDLLDHLG